MYMPITTRAASLLGLVLACATDGGRGGGDSASVGIDPSAGSLEVTGDADSDGDTDAGTDGTAGTDPAATTDAHDDGPGSDPKFDLEGGAMEGIGEEATGCETQECECTIPDHVPCDAGNDLFQAVGLTATSAGRRGG